MKKSDMPPAHKHLILGIQMGKDLVRGIRHLRLTTQLGFWAALRLPTSWPNPRPGVRLSV
jgi:hypothetical protein